MKRLNFATVLMLLFGLTCSAEAYTIVASTGTGGTISPTGSVTYIQGQTYAINPNAGYKINSILVNGHDMGALSSYTFSEPTVASNQIITANFAPDSTSPTLTTYTITASSSDRNGIISPAGTVAYKQGNTFAINPKAGYVIANVQVNGQNRGAINSYTFSSPTVTKNQTIKATFALATLFTSPAQIIMYTTNGAAPISLDEAYKTGVIGPGVQGPQGLQGSQGLTGLQGASGDNGLNSLINTVNESPGLNCSTGGIKIQVGIDQNRSSILDAGEVAQTKYVCNGASEQNANVNGTWNWNETQFMPISGGCEARGAVNSYTLTFVQNGNQFTVTLPQGSGVASNSLTGTVTGSIILITGGIQLDDGKSLQDIMNLISSEDGTTLSGTLFQSSADTGICNGIYKINATKSP